MNYRKLSVYVLVVLALLGSLYAGTRLGQAAQVSVRTVPEHQIWNSVWDQANAALRTNAIAGGVVTIVGPLPAGTNNIGDVDVLTLPPLVASAANIGDVDVASLPALSSGAGYIGYVTPTTQLALVAGSAIIGQVTVTQQAALPSGAGYIGNVTPTTQLPLVGGAGYVGYFTPTAQLPLTASEYHIGEVGGRVVTATFTVVRPADTAIYAANDAINAAVGLPITFTNFARVAGGSGEIMKARLVTDAPTYTCRIRMHLYNYAPAPYNDNAVHTILFADAGISLGYVDFPALSTSGTGSTASMAVLVASNAVTVTLPLPFVCAPGSRNLYALIETLDAFMPLTSTQFLLELTAAAD